MRALQQAWGWWWQLSWPALRQQWGRQLAALLTIALGLALAGAVHWINGSALAQFEQAARQSSAQADLQLQASPGAPGLTEAVYAQLAERQDIAALAPKLQGSVQVRSAEGRWVRLRLLGLDLLQMGSFHPQWLPRGDSQRLADALGGPAVLISEAALRQLQLTAPATLQMDLPAGQVPVTVAGTVPDANQAVLIMDVAWAQALLQRPGELDAILLRMGPGQAVPTAWPEGIVAVAPQDQARQQADDARRLTQAYRLNLGVLSLMALFVGAFMVFAVHSLSVAQRLPQLALLGVLGMSARQRLGLLLGEALLLGLAGAVLGLLLALGLAELGLRQLGGDLGSGMMGLSGAPPVLQTSTASILGLLLLGPVVSLGAAALPLARLRRLPAAQVLKGLGSSAPDRRWWLLGPALLLLSLPLAALPPVAELPLGAYGAMVFLLLGALGSVPWLLRLITGLMRRRAAGSALPLLAVERARDQAGEAGRLIAGVLVALALAVAMLVMIASFRLSLDQWLMQMLPADLYLRQTARDTAEQARPLDPALADKAAALPGVTRVEAQRTREIGLRLQDGRRDRATLLARPLDHRLPLQGKTVDAPPDALGVYINEAMRDALGLAPGARFTLQVAGRDLPASVRGIWRDYSRQSSAVLVERADWQRVSGDGTLTELALWLSPQADLQAVQSGLRQLASSPESVEMASAGELRRFSLAVFDRSFAITYWLQAVGLGLGLFGVAASLSAQLLARRREFGLLMHLGLTRAMLRRLVLGETLIQGLAGALMGLLVGLAISAVLVFRLNPQSFHWSMDWQVPWTRVAELLLASLAATCITAAVAAARALGSRQGEALRAVREDW
ncbi:ABC transporter permease [Roseateles depolymerans]|uniref:ABC-type transport system, involved in lipoprotein release, permease component n=1 Tax=Roseateles depolymerans TaxID=76731 RepID=A0A0U3E368_9BURK|nr:FtsX-like permease family protein [Roseateles depolymerans]ALV07637.1 ABC-type transport system, involved in lipoprotein release, permease component [Roseateles depolymerans]REG22141.1 putative ABC transport system permease protein [Roseateles depolymerans]